MYFLQVILSCVKQYKLRPGLLGVAILLSGTLHFGACVQPSSGMSAIGKPDAVLRDVSSVLYYKRDYLRFSEDFVAYDSAFQKLSREQFLKTLSSGNYLPLRLHTADSSNAYLLYRVPDSTDISIRHTLGQMGEEYYGYYKREGEKLPPFNFQDLDGKRYTNETMAGKTVVIKCWFIHCWACVQEMPRLNQLVGKYSKRDDVLFLSLAFDTETELRAFMKKTPFNYAVLPVSNSYLSDTLKINAYPTHIIVNKEGRITKVVSSADELAVLLPKEIH